MIHGTQLGVNGSQIDDAQIWQGLKRAIASSSGFQRWRLENQLVEETTDELVRRYLRETLATLAY